MILQAKDASVGKVYCQVFTAGVTFVVQRQTDAHSVDSLKFYKSISPKKNTIAGWKLKATEW